MYHDHMWKAFKAMEKGNEEMTKAEFADIHSSFNNFTFIKLK